MLSGIMAGDQRTVIAGWLGPAEFEGRSGAVRSQQRWARATVRNSAQKRQRSLVARGAVGGGPARAASAGEGAGERRMVNGDGTKKAAREAGVVFAWGRAATRRQQLRARRDRWKARRCGRRRLGWTT